MNRRHVLLTTVALATVALATAGPRLAAQTPPVIAVQFRLHEPVFRQEYAAADVQQIEHAFADTIARLLSDSLGFGRFDAGAAAAPDTLVVTLDPKDRTGTTPPYETGFYVELRGLHPAPERYWRVFRTVDDFLLARGKPTAFLRELQVKFTANEVGSMEDALHAVPIATQATMLLDPIVGVVAWVMPFTRESFCMGRATTLHVANTIQATFAVPKVLEAQADSYAPAQGAPADLQRLAGSALGIAIGPADGIDLIKRAPAGSVRVDGVYIDHYHRASPCGDPTPPAAASFPGGGGAP